MNTNTVIVEYEILTCCSSVIKVVKSPQKCIKIYSTKQIKTKNFKWTILVLQLSLSFSNSFPPIKHMLHCISTLWLHIGFEPHFAFYPIYTVIQVSKRTKELRNGAALEGYSALFQGIFSNVKNILQPSSIRHVIHAHMIICGV